MAGPVSLTDFDDEPYRCCALTDGHDGPCAIKCVDCGGTGECLECGNGGCLCDDVVHCDWCDGSHTCPSCYEGYVEDDVFYTPAPQQSP